MMKYAVVLVTLFALAAFADESPLYEQDGDKGEMPESLSNPVHEQDQKRGESQLYEAESSSATNESAAGKKGYDYYKNQSDAAASTVADPTDTDTATRAQDYNSSRSNTTSLRETTKALPAGQLQNRAQDIDDDNDCIATNEECADDKDE